MLIHVDNHMLLENDVAFVVIVGSSCVEMGRFDSNGSQRAIVLCVSLLSPSVHSHSISLEYKHRQSQIREGLSCC